MDNLFGTPPSGAGQNPPTTQPNPADTQILSTLTELKDSLGAFSTRLDDMDAKINEVKTPITPEPQTTWKPKTWDEIPQKAEEIASQVVDEKLEAQRLEAEEKSNQETQQKQAIDSYLDKQVTELETAGAIPKVENKTDPNDPGNAARRELFGLAAKLGSMDLTKVAENLDIMHKSGYAFDPKANGMIGAYVRSGMPGASAPVSIPGRSAGTPNTGMPSAEAIHKAKSFESLKTMAGME
jgi:hypothetical protein